MTEVHRQNNRRWQLSLLALLLIPVGSMLAIIYYHGEQVSLYSANPGSTLCQTLLQSNDLDKGQPTRDIPDTYNSIGSVDDRYVVVIDPKTGQMIIHDTLGGVGTNNTSVDGSRAQLAKDMISLEQYAIQHKGVLRPEDYDWLRHLARTGMQLAFGAPGIKPDLQLEAKQELLIEFHNLSSNPSTSMAHSEIFLQTEQASKMAEAAYQQITDPGTPASSIPAASGGNHMLSDVTGALGSLMAFDPVSPPLISMTGLPLASSTLGALAAQVSPLLLGPTVVSLTASASPFNIVSSGTDAIAVGASAPLSPASSVGSVSPSVDATASPSVDATASTVVNSIGSSTSVGVAATNSSAAVVSAGGSTSSSDAAVSTSASVAAPVSTTSLTSSSSSTSSTVPTVSTQVSQSVSSTAGVSATSSVSSVGTSSTGTTFNNWSNTGATGSSYTYPTSSNSYTGFAYNTGTSGTTSTSTSGTTTNAGSVQGYYQTIFNSK